MSFNDRTLLAPDGTRIAYAVAGSGPAVVFHNGLTTTTTFWKHLRPMLLARHTVLTWDLPGHGRSGPALTPGTATIEAQPSLVARIMDQAGVERATHIGFSVGCQIVLETYKQLPDRCEALIILLGCAGRVLDTVAAPLHGPTLELLFERLPEQAFARAFRALVPITTLAGVHGLARRIGLTGPNVSNEDLREITEHMCTLDPTTLQRMARSAGAHSAHEVLERVRVPMLIVAGHKDPFAPATRVGVEMHRVAKTSELMELPAGTHTSLLDQADEIAEAVESFMARKAHHAQRSCSGS